MPYLTGVTPTTANTDFRTGLGIPGYAHPLLAPTEWGELTRPGTPWTGSFRSGGPGDV
ncbi:hypothetical protein ACQF36_07440 [Streptomyces sp. Marseille-Q5077]|uniref:hypothetical protein n=1 Tax=Streptomyces sp. Marseille-Q5077 TaxID=3418995 RepID=UPI003CFC7D50